MKQLLQHQRSGEILIEDIPAPMASPGTVIVRNQYSLVSAGTERATVGFARSSLLSKARARPDLVRVVLNKVRTDGLMATYRSVKSRLDQYVPLGYSSAGIVAEVGEGVTHVAVGDLVACAGSGYASHAEVVAVPRNLVVRVPESLPAQDAAFATLGAIALQGIRRAELTPGESVGVIGLGLLGQLTVQILRAYGFPVLGLDIDAAKVSAVREQGIEAAGVIGTDDAEALARGISGEVGVDAVIITAAASSNEPVDLAGRILRERGRVSAVGDVGLEIPRRIYYPKELDLRISRSYGPGRYDESYEEHGVDYPIAYARWTEQRNMSEFLRLAALGRVDISGMVTHTFDLSDAKSAYSLVLDGPADQPFLGVLLKYSGEAGQIGHIRILRKSSTQSQTASDQLVIGLVGAGNFVQTTVLPAISSLDKSRVRAVASARGVSGQDLASRLNADFVTTDYTDITGDPEINLVIAAARHDLNPEVAIKALEAGKNVHVEKPLALTSEQLGRVGQAAQASSGRLMVGFNRRFAPMSVALRDHFKNRSTPLLMHARINAGFVPAEHWVHDPVEGGGRILGEVCHFVDLLQYFCGSRPQRVYASRMPEDGQSVLVDDNVSIVIDFADGSRGTIDYSALGAADQPKEYFDVMGSGRSATLDNFRELNLYTGSRPKSQKSRQDKGHGAQFKAFADSIISGKPAPVPFEELAASTAATLAVIESLRIGSPVEVVIPSAQLESDGVSD